MPPGRIQNRIGNADIQPEIDLGPGNLCLHRKRQALGLVIDIAALRINRTRLTSLEENLFQVMSLIAHVGVGIATSWQPPPDPLNIQYIARVE